MDRGMKLCFTDKQQKSRNNIIGNAAGCNLIFQNSQPCIQRQLQVLDTNYTEKYAEDKAQAEVNKADVNACLITIFNEVMQHILGELSENTPDNKKIGNLLIRHYDSVSRQLMDWITDEPPHDRMESPELPKRYGRKCQNRYYRNYRDLAMGLIGWVEAKPGRKAELELAHSVETEPEIEIILDGIIRRVWEKISQLEPGSSTDDIRRELTTGKVQENEFGEYRTHLNRSRKRPDWNEMGPDLLAVMEKPENLNFEQKITILHDAARYFTKYARVKTAGSGIVKTDTKYTLVTTGIDETGNRTTSQMILSGDKKVFEVRGMEDNHPSTRREDNISTKMARERKIPVWAGQSFTASEMFDLVRWAEDFQEGVEECQHIVDQIDTIESEAVAFGISAYWRIFYDHTCFLSPHTIYEVFDIAQNHGVDFHIVSADTSQQEIKQRIPKLIEKFKKGDEPESFAGIKKNAEFVRNTTNEFLKLFQKETYAQIESQNQELTPFFIRHAQELISNISTDLAELEGNHNYEYKITILLDISDYLKMADQLWTMFRQNLNTPDVRKILSEEECRLLFSSQIDYDLKSIMPERIPSASETDFYSQFSMDKRYPKKEDGQVPVNESKLVALMKLKMELLEHQNRSLINLAARSPEMEEQYSSIHIQFNQLTTQPFSNERLADKVERMKYKNLLYQMSAFGRETTDKLRHTIKAREDEVTSSSPDFIVEDKLESFCH